MREYCDKAYFKKRKRRTDVISYDHVEETRVRLGFKRNELAELMGLSTTQYRRCEKAGRFLTFNFYAAMDAIENAALHSTLKKLVHIHELRTGMKINLNGEQDELNNSNDESDDNNVDSSNDSSDESQEEIV